MIDDQVGADVGRAHLAYRFRHLLAQVGEKRDRDLARERHVDLVRYEGQHGRRPVGDHFELDAVEIWSVLPPVVGVARQLDGHVRIEVDHFEGPRANRLGAHGRRADVAGVDGREARGDEGQERRLRAPQLERDLVIAGDGDLLQVLVPVPTGILAELVLPLFRDGVPGTLNVGAGERLAIVPLDAFAQLEGEPRAIGAPGPAFGKLGDDRVHAVPGLVLLVHDQVVVDGHERHDRRNRGFLVDRGAGRRIAMVDAKRAPGFLGEGGPIEGERQRYR